MYDIRENILHGIAQYQDEAVRAEKAGNEARAELCRAVVSVLSETLKDLDSIALCDCAMIGR